MDLAKAILEFVRNMVGLGKELEAADLEKRKRVAAYLEAIATCLDRLANVSGQLARDRAELDQHLRGLGRTLRPNGERIVEFDRLIEALGDVDTFRTILALAPEPWRPSEGEVRDVMLHAAGTLTSAAAMMKV